MKKRYYIVMFVLALLGSFLFCTQPLTSLKKSRNIMLLANGRSIQQAIFAFDSEREEYINPRSCWPASHGEGSFSTSTEYFKWLVTNGVLNVSGNFFGGLEVEPFHGESVSDLAAESVNWCIVADVNESTPENVPVIFSRNLMGDNLSELQMPTGGEGSIVFITKSGAGYSLFDGDFSSEVYSNLFNVSGLTNKVLRP